MKEYLSFRSNDKTSFPDDDDYSFKQVTRYLNTMATKGWELKGCSVYGSISIFASLVFFLERDKPESEASEPAQE